MNGYIAGPNNRSVYVNHVFYIKTIFSALIISAASFRHVNLRIHCVVIVAKLHFLYCPSDLSYLWLNVITPHQIAGFLEIAAAMIQNKCQNH